MKKQDTIKKIYYKGALSLECEKNGWSEKQISKLIRIAQTDSEALKSFIRTFRGKFSIANRIAKLESGILKY